MKAIQTASILFLAVAASTAYVVLRPATPEPDPAPTGTDQIEQEIPRRIVPAANAVVPMDHPVAVEALEERGDAMMFEIDALQHMPYDLPIVMPFEQSAP